MKKTLVKIDKSRNQASEEAWGENVQHLQNLVDLYNVTGLPKLQTEDLQRIFTDTNNLLFDKLTKGEQAHLTIGTGDNRTHLAIDKGAAINILIKPAGYNEFIDNIQIVAEALKSRPNNQYAEGSASMNQVAIDFIIDGDGQVQLSNERIDKNKEIGNQYINSDKANKLYSFLKEVETLYYKNEIELLTRSGIDVVFTDYVEKQNDTKKEFQFSSKLFSKDAEWAKLESVS